MSHKRDNILGVRNNLFLPCIFYPPFLFNIFPFRPISLAHRALFSILLTDAAQVGVLVCGRLLDAVAVCLAGLVVIRVVLGLGHLGGMILSSDGREDGK